MLRGCWFPCMVCLFICWFRPIFSMGSCLKKKVHNGIGAFWTHPPRRRRFFFYLVALFAFWANLPSASSNFGRAFILNKNDQTYSSKRWLSRWSSKQKTEYPIRRRNAHVQRTGLKSKTQTPVSESWVASSMCAMTRQTQLRSTDHVCKCKKHDVA